MLGNTATHLPQGLGGLPGMTAMATHQLKKSIADVGVPELPEFRDTIHFRELKEFRFIPNTTDFTAVGEALGLLNLFDLFAKAGLPTKRTDVAALWKNGWDGYVAAGERFKAANLPGTAWTDTASGMFNAMVGQSPNQYYDAAGNLIYSTNPVVAGAWNEAMKVAQGGLTARLAQFTQAWNQAFTTGQFATVACPSWMIGYIKGQTGTLAGRWDVTTAPGGTGDWGGSYLAVPKASRHRQEAAALAVWLTSAPQQVTVFEKTGVFPSNRVAAQDPAVRGFADPYFGAPGDPAPIGRIFGDSAAKLPVAVLGVRDQTVKDLITKGGITRVETQGENPAKSWKKVVSDVTAATG